MSHIPHWQVLGEVCDYGRHQLRMNNAAMARELCLSSSRIDQILRRYGSADRRCACGHRITAASDYCSLCKPSIANPRRIPVTCYDCNRSYKQAGLYICSDGHRRCLRCGYRNDKELRVTVLLRQFRSLKRRLEREGIAVE